MYNFEYFLSFYLFLFSCVMFGFYFKHLMLMVITLEFMMIFLSYNLFYLMVSMEISMYLFLYFLTLSVCESVLILSLIVLIVRFYGNDYSNSVSMMKW